MRILFVTSEHPSRLYGGLGTFTREYVRELRKYADVVCVYLHLSREKLPECDETVDYIFAPNKVFEAFSPEARILEVSASFRAQIEPIIQKFKPDVIHCNDRQTYLPFRFDKNVFYSSHLIFTDLLDDSVIDDTYFQEMKVERCALETSAVVAVYSDFAAKSADRVSGGMCSPVVLPLGLRVDKFLKKPAKVKNGNDLIIKDDCRKIKVAFFGRFENIQKGINDFIFAVNNLGLDFKERFNIEYSLHGKGCVEPGLDVSLFDKIDFLEGEKLYKAYKDSDIVVMPSRYEPFGFTGLEAMASGALVLLPKGLGMDMYAEPGWNCLEIPNIASGIAEVLRDAVENLDKYKILRENAVRTAKNWSWERCVKSHMYIYREMAKNRCSQISSAYRLEEREMLDKYRKVSDVEKIHCSEVERKAAQKILHDLKEFSGKKVLVLTGAYFPDEDELPENVQVFSVLNDCKDGITVRPECLPFSDKEFDLVVVSGAWETVIDPCTALVEIQRICKNRLVILFNKALPHAWQTFQMDMKNDWQNLSCNSWEIDISDIFNLESTVSYGTVNFNFIQQKEVVNEIIA